MRAPSLYFVVSFSLLSVALPISSMIMVKMDKNRCWRMLRDPVHSFLLGQQGTLGAESSVRVAVPVSSKLYISNALLPQSHDTFIDLLGANSILK